MMVTLLWTAGMNWFTTIDIVHNRIETDDVDDDHRGNDIDIDIDIVHNRIETNDVDDDHHRNDGASHDNDDDQDHNDLDDAEEG